MFASLGFKVDTSGLVVFKKAIADARGELTNLRRGAKQSTSQMRNLRNEVTKLSASMGKIKGATSAGNVSKSYSNIAASARKLDNALKEITGNQRSTTRAIGKINSSVIAGAPHWAAYRQSVVQARIALRNLNQDLGRLRANSRIDVRIRNSGGNGGGGGGSGGGGLGAAGGMAAGLGLKGFLSNIVPTLALTGIGGGVGYGGKMMVEASRDQVRMESMIQMTAKSAEEYKDTIDYVRREGLRLGQNSAELGKSFAQISMSAEKLSQQDKKEMFTGFSEFMMAMGTGADDQKGIFRAFNQMFSNNRLLQEEINQLSDRGIPATLVYDAAMKAYGLDSISAVKAMQEKGQLDPSKVLPLMAKMLQSKANDSGAIDKMRNSSIYQQGRFQEQLRQTSMTIMEGGLDEKLGDIFKALTELVKQVENVAVSLKFITDKIGQLNDMMNEWTKGNSWAIWVLLLFVGRLKYLRKAIGFATRSFRRNGSIIRALMHLIKGGFGNSIKMIIGRFGIWGAAIVAVWQSLKWLGKELSDDKYGWTVFDELSLKMRLTGLEMDLLGAKWSLFWGNVAAEVTSMPNWLLKLTGFDPREVGEWKMDYQQSGGSHGVQGVSPYPAAPRPNLKNFNMNMQDFLKGGVPKASANSIQKQPITLNAYIQNSDGTTTRTPASVFLA